MTMLDSFLHITFSSQGADADYVGLLRRCLLGMCHDGHDFYSGGICLGTNQALRPRFISLCISRLWVVISAC